MGNSIRSVTAAGGKSETSHRRAFLFAGMAAAAGGGAVDAEAPAPALETMTQWLKASEQMRRLALPSCLDRIRTMEPSIHAWVQVSPQRPAGRGSLSEIPFGVKDIIETRGLATEYGSPIYKGRIGTSDAAIIRELRKRGAILLGKTQTTAFAYQTPAPTRNPRNTEHTPGGSSSGSAAAVAADMVPFTVGEQTRGSVLRPASFCGVTGFKPTYGLLSMEGVLPLSRSLDTLGFFTHTPNDMAALWESLGHSAGRSEEFDLGAPEPMPDVDPAMAAAFQDSLTRLRRAGASIRSIDIAGALARLAEANLTVMLYEGARFHKQRYEEYGDRLADLADLVRQGLRIPVNRYDEILRFIGSSKTQFSELFKRTPVILTPAAVGPAPAGLGSTGDARMNAPWTALGTPAISIPMPVGNGLPLGLQLTAERGEEARVLRAAVRLYNILGHQA
jgi:Asp-tRNA(Asn)/Glu-tRNA(Gln) amidotransferase A subunit family amidase